MASNRLFGLRAAGWEQHVAAIDRARTAYEKAQTKELQDKWANAVSVAAGYLVKRAATAGNDSKTKTRNSYIHKQQVLLGIAAPASMLTNEITAYTPAPLDNTAAEKPAAKSAKKQSEDSFSDNHFDTYKNDEDQEESQNGRSFKM